MHRQKKIFNFKDINFFYFFFLLRFLFLIFFYMKHSTISEFLCFFSFLFLKEDFLIFTFRNIVMAWRKFKNQEKVFKENFFSFKLKSLKLRKLLSFDLEKSREILKRNLYGMWLGGNSTYFLVMFTAVNEKLWNSSLDDDLKILLLTSKLEKSFIHKLRTKIIFILWDNMWIFL